MLDPKCRSDKSLKLEMLVVHFKNGFLSDVVHLKMFCCSIFQFCFLFAFFWEIILGAEAQHHHLTTPFRCSPVIACHKQTNTLTVYNNNTTSTKNNKRTLRSIKKTIWSHGHWPSPSANCTAVGSMKTIS